jgi:hypothetical protein
VLGLSTAGLLTVAGSIANVNWIPAMFFLLLAAITLTCIQISLNTGDRGAFYFGWLLLLIRVLSWFMFTQTDLMFKSLLFILSGVATIAVGLWFERRLQQNITAGT